MNVVWYHKSERAFIPCLEQAGKYIQDFQVHYLVIDTLRSIKRFLIKHIK